MENKKQSILIKQFIEGFSTFPASLVTSIVDYDTNRLVKVLHEKEVIEIFKISKEQFDTANSIDFELGKIVNELIKEVHFNRSLQEYFEIEKKIEDNFSGYLYIYVKQSALSVKSLYYYKIKDFKKALSLTIECIVLNDYLVQQGIYSLNLRCFEQNKNISRIYFRDNQFELGYKLISNLLNYLLNGKDNELFGNIFKNQFYWSKIPLLRETYSYELFTMIIEDMIRFNINNHIDFLPNIWYINLDFEVNTPDRQIIYNWIYINKQLNCLNYEEYLESLMYFFQQPYSQFYDILKISLLIDFRKVILNLNIINKEILIKKIGYFIKENLISNNQHKFLIDKIFQT
jgi:hypothetical protein